MVVSLRKVWREIRKTLLLQCTISVVHLFCAINYWFLSIYYGDKNESSRRFEARLR